MILYGHPFSSYTWKAQIAFYEKEVAHEFRAIETEPPFTHYDELRAHWPVGQFPLIVDDGRPLFEASIIAEYLDQRSDAGPRLIPADPQAALEVRFLDRIFDNHFQARFQAAVAEYLPFITETPDLARVARAREMQRERFLAAGAGSVSTNARCSTALIEILAEPDAGGLQLLRDAVEKLKFSARGYHRVLKVARTLADLDGKEVIGRIHLAEAISYRIAGERLSAAA